MHRSVLIGVSAALLLLGNAAARAEPVREIVAYDDVRIEVIAEGSGPLVVLLPGAAAGLRISTRSPRGWPKPAFACCGRSRAARAKARDR